MTNQLFLEVLDGRIPLPAKPKPPTLAEAIRAAADTVAACFGGLIDAFTPLINALQDTGVIDRPAPTEPRARALAAKQQQGHGPPLPAEWRGRERTTNFRSQS